MSSSLKPFHDIRVSTQSSSLHSPAACQYICSTATRFVVNFSFEKKKKKRKRKRKRKRKEKERKRKEKEKKKKRKRKEKGKKKSTLDTLIPHYGRAFSWAAAPLLPARQILPWVGPSDSAGERKRKRKEKEKKKKRRRKEKIPYIL